MMDRWALAGLEKASARNGTHLNGTQQDRAASAESFLIPGLCDCCYMVHSAELYSPDTVYMCELC